MIGAFSPTANMTGYLILLDRLLYYPGITAGVTTLQALTNTNTLSRETTGRGVRAFLEVQVILGAGTPTATILYTDDGGVAGNSSVVTSITTAPVGRIIPTTMYFPLAAGDNGMRSVQSIQFSGVQTGTFCLVLAEELAILPLPQVGLWSERELVAQVNTLPRIGDGACLMWAVVHAGAPATPTMMGSIDSIFG